MPTLTKTHQIQVTVQGTTIQVVPDTLVMTLLDEVQWSAAQGRPFKIAFEGAGPFEGRELTFGTATGRNRPRVRGRFKYTVISEDDPSVRLDPVIIVEDPPTEEEP